MRSETATPVTESERHAVLDILRGLALFGVLLVNLRELSLYNLMPRAAREALPTAGVDAVLDVFMAAFVDIKAVTVFSLLFGIGFALQMQRAAHDGERTRRYVRRLLLLLLIGIAHAWLLWWGDILRYYAVLGLLLVPLARLGPRALALLGVALTLLFALPMLRPLMQPLLPALLSSEQAAAEAFAAFSGSDAQAALAANLDYDLRMRLANWSLLLFMAGRLLLGAALGLAGVIQDPLRHRRFWRRMLVTLLPLGLLLTAAGLLREHGLLFVGGGWRSDLARNLFAVLRNAGVLALALGYMAAVVQLCACPAPRRWLALFAPVGRMALSNYLAQSVIGVAVFYGLGLGLGPRYGLAGTLLGALLIFGLQLWLSRWWLAHFRFGPAEWAWRSLTYGRRQPLRRRAATVPAATAA